MPFYRFIRYLLGKIQSGAEKIGDFPGLELELTRLLLLSFEDGSSEYSFL